MDRRQKKTRTAIFKAFTELLSEKNISHITVGEIIERADIGRATFYAHFETKDFLLKEFCEELFEHIFEAEEGSDEAHSHIFDCEAPSSVFLHLFQHVGKNDNNIRELLSCENNELFLQYFKVNLVKLVKNQSYLFEDRKAHELPEEFWINHICSTFVETLRWWIAHKCRESAETITKFFLLAV